MKKIIAVFLVLAMLFAFGGCAKGNPALQGDHKCTLEIRCDTILDNMDKMNKEKLDLVPEDGIILAETTAYFNEGETVFDVFRRTLREKNIHFEYVDASAYSSTYIEGIGNIYEFDCGAQSGWMYSVNGIFPGLGCSSYTLTEGDKIVFSYTCNMGADIGGEYES